MARLIPTGKHEAIDLKSLHSSEIIQIDEEATNLKERNGGYADWFMEMRKGVFTLLRVNASFLLQSKKQD
jgi:hypothetical protein